MDKNLNVRAANGLLRLLAGLAVLLFIPARTFDYWEAWIFIGVFFVCSLAITVYLAIKDPKLLERRMKGGPSAEKEKTQKIIMAVAMLSFCGLIVLPAIDHRFAWSAMPASIVILGDALILLGYAAVLFVFRENTYGASTIQIAEGQRVISTGPYAIVRHPMYSGGLVLLLGIPLALGSWWGLLMFIPAVAAVVWRLVDEERFLSLNLAGYAGYKSKVRYRLIPSVW
jgi:protein-S-isoprenylcysteine O-methyltransferase Ste14